MTGFRWLLLKDGTVAVGTKDDPGGRVSWAVLMPNGGMRAVNDSEVLDTRPAKPPEVISEETHVIVGTFK